MMLRKRQEWLRLFGIPLITACALYAVALLHLGGLQSYFTIYLRGMLGNYILSGGPVWARGLVAWERMYINVLDFSAWFPILIIILFLLSLPSRRRAHHDTPLRPRLIGLSFTAVCFSVLLLVRAFFPVQFPWWNIWIGAALMFLAVSIGAFLASVRVGGFPAFIKRTWRHGLAVYLTLTAIGLGSGFHGQYFALALPVYFAFFLLFLRRQASGHPFSRWMVLGCTALAALILLSSQSFTRKTTLAAKIDAIRMQEAQQQSDAVAIDAVLYACDIDQYYFIESPTIPYTKHSPLNYYLYTRIEHITRYHPVFFEESFRRLEEAKIVITNKEYNEGTYIPAPRKGNQREICIGNNVKKFLDTQFSKQKWDCARKLPGPKGYALHFRKNPNDDSINQIDFRECLRLEK